MYKVIKDLAGFELDEIITQDKINELNLTDETLKSWIEAGYIQAESEGKNKHKEVKIDTYNADNTLLYSQ
jgi:hypothetical protein